MLIRDLTIHNFGIYGGTHTFRLNPVPGKDDKNLILFIGKNGVGKTTFVEAIKLVFWGSLSVRNSISKEDYESYLVDRIHRINSGNDSVDTSSVSIQFDYVQLGITYQYFIERSWKKNKSGITEKLTIIENEQELETLTEKEKELFLRDLFPPGYKDLFFFDGEKLNMFDQNSSADIISQSVRSLLGLDTIDQLKKDINYYLREEARSHQFDELTIQLDEVNDRIVNLLNQQLELKGELNDINDQVKKISQDHIPSLEQEITKYGRWDESQLNDLKRDKSRVEQKIEQLHKQLIEHCNGLIPFATAPRFLYKLSNQLNLEKEYRVWDISNTLISKQIKKLKTQKVKNVLAKKGGSLESSKVDLIVKDIERLIKDTLPKKPLDEKEIIHNFSEEDQNKIQNWLDQAQKDEPTAFFRVANELTLAKEKLSEIEKNLSWTVEEKITKPLFEKLADLNKKLGELQSKRDDLVENEKEIEKLINFHTQRRNGLEEKISNQDNVSNRLKLAQETNRLLVEYSEKLQEEKLSRLGNLIVKKFHLLCRKEDMFNKAVVSSNDYSIALYKDKRKFSKNSLSAGEKQLLSLSVLWALYEISGLPAPIIIDTPLSRLDSVHRTKLIKHFFLKASQQMFILGTDEEIDQLMTKELSNHISHLYEMNFDSKTRSTEASKYSAGEIHHYLKPLIEA